MKKAFVLGLTFSSLLVGSVAHAAVTNYVAKLNGAQEAPPVTTNASGSATLAFDDATRKLTGTVSMTGLKDVALAHIHNGACGAAGNVEVTLMNPTPSSVAVDATLSSAQAASLAAGNLYLNIHTAANPNGELRGQLAPESSPNNCGSGAGGGGGGGTGGGGGNSDDGGCSTSGTNAGSVAVMLLGVGVALASLRRRRR